MADQTHQEAQLGSWWRKLDSQDDLFVSYTKSQALHQRSSISSADGLRLNTCQLKCLEQPESLTLASTMLKDWYSRPIPGSSMDQLAIPSNDFMAWRIFHFQSQAKDELSKTDRPEFLGKRSVIFLNINVS
jgi:hypothetical protein